VDLYQSEVRLLSAFLRDRHVIALAVAEGFHPDLLTSPLARRVAKALLELHAVPAAVVDEPGLRARLVDRGLLTAEMERYLTTVLQAAPANAGEVMAQIEVLKARESRDLLTQVYELLGAHLFRPDSQQADIMQVTAEAIHRLLEIQRRRVRRQVQPIAEAFASLLHETGPRPEHHGQLGYSVSPFDRLNALLSGLRRGFYYGLAGAPRRGKTNLALELACHVAANHKIPVLYYSWEQTRRVLAARLIAKEVGINPASILAGADALGPVGPRVQLARGAVARYAPYLHLVEAGRKDTLDRIRAHAHNLMQEFQTNEVVLFFDYLQKIPLTEHLEDWKARTDRISTELAELSLELNCPVFAISPLDKDGCKLDERPAEDTDVFNPFNRPTMHHAMGSGDLEYDLDVAMVLAKDWKATADLHQLIEARAKAEGFDPGLMPRVDIVNLFVDKNRDAPEAESNTVQFAFFVTLNKFIELDYKLEDEYRPDYHGFAKLQDIYTYLRDLGYGPPREPAAAQRTSGSGGRPR
jgi:replicative DNA helicase